MLIHSPSQIWSLRHKLSGHLLDIRYLHLTQQQLLKARVRAGHAASARARTAAWHLWNVAMSACVQAAAPWWHGALSAVQQGNAYASTIPELLA